MKTDGFCSTLGEPGTVAAVSAAEKGDEDLVEIGLMEAEKAQELPDLKTKHTKAIA